MKSELEMLEMETLVKFAVPEEKLADALAFVDKHKADPRVSDVLRSYYTTLPEAREEMAKDLQMVEEKQGISLFALKAESHCYYYIATGSEVLFAGDDASGISESETLEYFGFRNNKDLAEKVSQLIDSGGSGNSDSNLQCVVCGVVEGEMHILGCPVEQCPWCDGQLSRCNCRFDQLGVDEITDEHHLEQFEDLLEQKGRIPFKASQAPSYPVAGDDPGPSDDKSGA